MVLILLLASAVAIQGKTIYVPDDHSAIQDAIDASKNGDTVVVRPGTYCENISFRGKEITVASEKGPRVTTIDGTYSGRVVTFACSEDRSSVLDGFTVKNGVSGSGGGIYCYFSSPTISNNIITQNRATSNWGGGGILCSNSGALVTGNKIIDNFSKISGGGIRLEYCEARVTGNLIARNRSGDGGGIVSDAYTGLIDDCLVLGNEADRSGGGYTCWASSPLIVNTVFARNVCDVTWGWGGGLYCGAGATPTVVNCTLAENVALKGGAVHCCEASPAIVNTIMWDDDALDEGPEICLESFSTLTIAYSDVGGGEEEAHVDAGSVLNWGGGMIDQNPLFYDPTLCDYHLQWSSPCRDSGDSNLSVLPAGDLEGDPRVALGTVDMGADEYHYRLYKIGSVVPGEGLPLRIVGCPGMPVALFVDRQISLPPLSTQYGNFYLPWPPLWQSSVGTIPGNGILNLPATVPSNWVAGDRIPLQALVGPLNGPHTKLTNPLLLSVE